MGMQVQRKAGYAMYYFQVKPMTGEAYMAEHMMDINEAHDKMAHMGKDIVRKTMAWYGIKLMGKMEPCGACLKEKAWAKNTKKLTEHVATKAREWLYLDTTEGHVNFNWRIALWHEDSGSVLMEIMGWAYEE